MSKIKTFVLTFLSVFSLLFFATPTIAGGWPIYTWTWDNSDAWKSDYKMTYARVHLDPRIPCVGTTVTFSYENPQSGDSVNPGTYTFNEVGSKYSKYNGTNIPDCSTYAKFFSSNNNLKTGVAEFRTADGKTYSARFALNFNQPSPGNTEDREKYPLPWEEDYIKNHPNVPAPTTVPTVAPTSAPVSGINAWLLSQQLDGLNNRNIVIKWSAFDGYPGTFTIYGKTASNKNNWDKLLDGQRGPSVTVNIKDEDYYIKVYGCQDKWGTCVDSNILFLSKTQENRKIIPPQIPNSTIYPAQSSNDNKVDELNKKMENLQTQLDQSKKTQSTLEQRINDLVTFIKRIFPFFR